MKKNLILMLLLLAGAGSATGQEAKMVVKANMVNVGNVTATIPIELLATEGVTNTITNNEGATLLTTSSMEVGSKTKVDNAGFLCVGCAVGTLPPVPVQTITISAPTYSSFLLTGRNLQMEAAILPENADHQDVTWSENYPGDHISTAGVLNVPAISEESGEIVVRVTASAQDESGVSNYKDITVHQAVTGFTLTPADGPYIYGTPFQVSLTNLTPTNAYDKSINWTTSNATLSNKTNTAVRVTPTCGSCDVTATTKDGSGSANSVIVATEPLAGVLYNGGLYWQTKTMGTTSVHASCADEGGSETYVTTFGASWNVANRTAWYALYGNSKTFSSPNTGQNNVWWIADEAGTYKEGTSSTAYSICRDL
jgi:hypothetical protein